MLEIQNMRDNTSQSIDVILLFATAVSFDLPAL